MVKVSQNGHGRWDAKIEAIPGVWVACQEEHRGLAVDGANDAAEHVRKNKPMLGLSVWHGAEPRFLRITGIDEGDPAKVMVTLDENKTVPWSECKWSRR